MTDIGHRVPPYLIGIDGGGTHTTLALALATGEEVVRRVGRAGLVDPRRPLEAAEMLVELVHAAEAEAGLRGPALALVAGLAGVGSTSEREVVAGALRAAGVAERVVVCSDGETALQGALGDGPGLLLIAGTGSIAWGRAEDGELARCGGWGMVVGDEGSGYAVGRASMIAALRAWDGRGPQTALLPRLLDALALPDPGAFPSWSGRAAKAEIAALAVHVAALAREGDPVSLEILRAEAQALAAHAAALLRTLGPWTAPVPLVLHGGLARDAGFAGALLAACQGAGLPVEPRAAAADAVTGAVQLARRELAGPVPAGTAP